MSCPNWFPIPSPHPAPESLAKSSPRNMFHKDKHYFQVEHTVALAIERVLLLNIHTWVRVNWLPAQLL